MHEQLRVLFRQRIQMAGDNLLQSAAVFAQLRKRIACLERPVLARLVNLLLALLDGHRRVFAKLLGVFSEVIGQTFGFVSLFIQPLNLIETPGVLGPFGLHPQGIGIAPAQLRRLERLFRRGLRLFRLTANGLQLRLIALQRLPLLFDLLRLRIQTDFAFIDAFPCLFQPFLCFGVTGFSRES
jgi:hypothetical protein